MKRYPDLREFLTALPEGMKRRKNKRKQGSKKKKKKKPWDENVSDLSRLKIPKQKLREKKELFRSKNQDIAQELIEQQKRKHFKLKSEKREKDWEDEEARIERFNRRISYNPLLEAAKGETQNFQIQEAGAEDSFSDEYEDDEPSSQSEEYHQFKTSRITSSGKSEMLDSILNQLRGFLQNNAVEKKKTEEFRGRVLEIFERQAEKIRVLEEEITKLRTVQTNPIDPGCPPQLHQRVTSRPFNPPPRVAQIPTPVPTKPVYQDNKNLSALKNPVNDRNVYGLMGRSVF